MGQIEDNMVIASLRPIFNFFTLYNSCANYGTTTILRHCLKRLPAKTFDKTFSVIINFTKHNHAIQRQIHR